MILSMRRLLAMIVLASACNTTPVESPSPTLPTATPPAAGSASRAPDSTVSPIASTTAAPFVGAIANAPVSPEMITFASQGRSLIAIWSAGTPPPYLSRLMRADADGTWSSVYESDAMFVGLQQDLRRAAFIEYREKPQGGGASDLAFIVLDLTTRALVKVESYARTPATYHGGGGSPRGPSASIAIGGGMVAWSRVNELAGGAVEGELRVATLDDPSSFTTVGRSKETIVPIAVDEKTLVYLLGGADRDELRARELPTGKERSLVTVLRPTQTHGPSNLARSGSFVGWIEMPAATDTANARFRTVNITTGAARDIDVGARFCSGVTANAYGFVWRCSDTKLTALGYWDPLAWRQVDVTPATDGYLEAALDGFIWTGVVRNERRAVLFAPSR